jgi:DNA-binding MarR family transcriptional regulator
MLACELIFSQMLRISRAANGVEGGDGPREVIHAIADLVAVVEPRLLDLWKSTGMTFAQRRLLRRLRDGSRSAGALAAELDIAAPTLTRQLQKLEERGLISRAMDSDDRRRVVVTLTPSGERSLADHRIFGGGALAMAARDLPADQRRELVRSVAHLLRLARKHGETSADG